MAPLMDGNTKILIDECLSPELVKIAETEFGCFSTFVPWLGTPPRGKVAWEDPDIVKKALSDDYVLVTNNRRDFVVKYYPASGASVHSGLIVIIEKTNLDAEFTLFRAVMDYIKTMGDTINKLVEIDVSGNISVAEWPNFDLAEPWQDPFKKK
jgi:predicted nuclease of predicted toxin-antitoxin system